MSRLGKLQRLALAVGAAASLAHSGNAAAAAAAPAFSLRGSAGAGADSNARRVFGGGDADLMGSALLAGAAKVPLGPLELGGAYQAAVRKFLRITSQDTLAQQAGAEIAVRPLATVLLALDGHAKDRRGGTRQYTDLQSALALRWRAVPELEVELRGGAHRFIDWTIFQFEYSYSSPELGGRVRYRLNRNHSISLSGDLGRRRYNALADIKTTAPDPPEVQREDGVLAAGASYTYRGDLQLSAGYQYYSADSNSYAETVRFHRVDFTLGSPLPWDLLLFAQLTLQLAEYPEGISLSKLITLDEDDERHNALSIKLVRPLGEQVDLELRYGVYVNVLDQNGTYLRQVASVGLAVRM